MRKRQNYNSSFRGGIVTHLPLALDAFCDFKLCNFHFTFRNRHAFHLKFPFSSFARVCVCILYFIFVAE